MAPSIRRTVAAKALQWRARHGTMNDPAGMPATVERDMQGSLAEYWRQRLEQHNNDSYAGVPMAKFPEDLRVYQHLIWAMRADVVIEVGTKWGGSLLWFRDQLRTFAAYGHAERRPQVIGVDIATGHAVTMLDRADPSWREQITLLDADITDPAAAQRIAAELAPGSRPLIVEDAAHTAEVTAAALRGLAPLVPPGGFFVVEDGHVDIPELHPDGPPHISQLGVDAGGVLPAVGEFLNSAAGADFEARPELELYGITSHPGGYLQRTDATQVGYSR